MTRYEKGFLTKCAEAGLDSHRSGALLKRALSTAGHEFAGSTLWGVVPSVGTASTVIGGMLGSSIGRDLTKEEIEELARKRGNLSNYIPGVAAYRRGQREGALMNAEMDLAREKGIKMIRPTRNTATEDLSVLNPFNIIGGPIGAIMGARAKHRTLEEQVEHDSRQQSIKNLLIPGYGPYHAARRLGASREVVEMFDGDNKDDKKKDKKKK